MLSPPNPPQNRRIDLGKEDLRPTGQARFAKSFLDPSTVLTWVA